MLLSLLAHIFAWMTKMDDRQVAQRARDMDDPSHNSAWMTELDVQSRPKGELHCIPIRQNCLPPGFSLSSLTGFKGTRFGLVPES